MENRKIVAVFGLGRYGKSVAKELIRYGHEVLVVDSDYQVVNDAVHEFSFCKCADVTDLEVLRQLGVANADVVIIAIAGNLEVSVMATMICKEIGVKKVVVKCADEMMCRICLKVGADQVVVPESESGIRLAKRLMCSGFVDLLEISKDVSMIELDVKKSWIGKSLRDLDLRKKYNINVVAIIYEGQVSVNISPEMPLESSMQLIIIANPKFIDKMQG